MNHLILSQAIWIFDWLTDIHFTQTFHIIDESLYILKPLSVSTIGEIEIFCNYHEPGVVFQQSAQSFLKCS